MKIYYIYKFKHISIILNICLYSLYRCYQMVSVDPIIYIIVSIVTDIASLQYRMLDYKYDK